MLTPQFILPMHPELVVDLFAGGGGASTGAAGEPITKTAQVRMCGNSVYPPLARSIVAANYAQQHAAQRRAA